MDLFQGKGKLKYSIEEKVGYKLVLELDQGIVDYYRSLIPKSKDVKSQMFRAHISVVRKETPKNLEFWGKYEGLKVDFEYSNWIYNDTIYWWLNAYSSFLEEVRLELGLIVKYYTLVPPKNYKKNFHITLGNVKHLPIRNEN